MDARMMSPEQDARVAELTLAGLTRSEIAQELRLSANQVSLARKRTGIYAPTNGGGRPSIPVGRVVSLTERNYTTRQIATILGCTDRTVIRARVKAGIAQVPAPRLTDDQRALADNLITDGASLAEVARTIGCSYSTIYRHFRGRGFTRSEIGQYSQLVRSMRRRGLRELIA